jgi:hypothetical protein
MLLRTLRIISVQLFLLTILSSSNGKAIHSMHYTVQRAETRFRLEDKWDQGQWGKTEALKLAKYMGTKPEHFPDTQAKLRYNDDNIFVFFRVEDQYVRAVAKDYHDAVCQDSCVEFFFTSGQDIAQGYFNVEVNCGATLLFHHQTARGRNQRQASIEDCKRIRIISSLPKRVDPEITEPTVWTVKYVLPVDILKKYAQVESPGPGVIWRANFYKCGDKTSRPHWLTWNPVDHPSPNFHLAQYFGTIVFE